MHIILCCESICMQLLSINIYDCIKVSFGNFQFVLTNALCCTVVCSEPGYLVTAPNRFIPERPETVCIDLYNVADDTDIRLTLLTLRIGASWRRLPANAQNETIADVSTIIRAQGTYLILNMKMNHDSACCYNYLTFVDVLSPS